MPSFTLHFFPAVSYQDLRGNPQAEVVVAPIRLDTATLPLTVTQPTAGSRLALETEFTLVIPEDALPGSVQLLFTPEFATYGGVDDTGSGQRVLVLGKYTLCLQDSNVWQVPLVLTIFFPRCLRFSNTTASSFESAGTHTFTLTTLATAVATTAEVTSVTPATSLIHGAIYDVTARYQDQAGNSQEIFVLTNMQCDVATDPIVSTHPDATVSGINGGVTYMDDAFTVVFNLPEPAASTSLQLAIEPTGTDRVGTIDYQLPRVVVFVDSVGATAGVKTITIGQMTTPNAENVVSITPSVDLLDGVIYQFTYSFRDTHGNSVASTVITAVRYAGEITHAPILTSPTFGYVFFRTVLVDGLQFQVSFVRHFCTHFFPFPPILSSNCFFHPVHFSSVLPSPFDLIFHLPERPYANSVQLIITPDGGTYIDSTAPRVIVFDSSAVENSGDHTLSISPLSALAASKSYVTSVTPNTNLVDGALYTMELKYSDGANNGPNSTLKDNIAFAGFETLPAYLHDPRVNKTMANAFYLNYTLSESALRGSVHLLLTFALGKKMLDAVHCVVFDVWM